MRLAVVSGAVEPGRRAWGQLLPGNELLAAGGPPAAARLVAEHGLDGAVVVWPETELGRAGAARHLEPLRGVPVVAVIPVGLLGDRVGAREAGATVVVAPYHPAELRLAHRPSELGRQRSLQVAGDVVVDAEAHQAIRRGQQLPLTPREFEVLTDLVVHRGRVRSRDALLVSVWGSTGYTANVVDSAVSGLRKQLEAHGPRVVHTVRGVGYVFRAGPPASDVARVQAERERLLAERDRLIRARDELLARSRRAAGRAVAPAGGGRLGPVGDR